MSGESATRTIGGIEGPAPGRWEIDPGHTSIAFVAKYLMVTKVRGHFAEFSGFVQVAERPEDSTAEITIKAASIDTGNPDRDQHLLRAQLLAALRAGRRHAHARGLLLELLEARAEAHLDALPAELALERGGRLRIRAREHLGRHLDHGHLRAVHRVHVGELDAHGARADQGKGGDAGKNDAASRILRFRGRRHGVDVTLFAANLKSWAIPEMI